MTTVDQILSAARAAGEKLPGAEAAALFAAAMRLAVDQGHAPPPRELRIDDAGVLTLLRDEAGSLPSAYLAPELAGEDPPRRSEPRVQVYAAGALGYELLAGRPPPSPPEVPGAEVQGLLGDLVKVALAADRRERFGDLRQLFDAVEGVQPRRSQEAEQRLLAALVRRAREWAGKASPPRADDSGRALRELSVRLDVLEASLQTLRGQHEAALRRPPVPPPAPGPGAGKIFFLALLAALLVVGAAGAVAFGLRAGAPGRVTSAASAPKRASASGGSEAKAPAGVEAAAPVAEATAGAGDVSALARDVARAQVTRGEKALETGNLPAAVASFRTALAGQADLPEAVRGLGRAYALQGRDAEARLQFERYLELAPTAPDSAEIRKVLAGLDGRGREGNKKAR